VNHIARRLMGIGTMAPQDADLRSLVAGAVPVDPDYEQFVYQWGVPFLEERLDMVGFTGAGRVLDAGCGLGNWTLALARHNAEVVAVDSHPGMRERTRVTCEAGGCANVSVVAGPLEQCRFDDGEFDRIWCSLLLEYVDREALMRRFQRWLRPGGQLYVSTNAAGRWLVKVLAGVAELDWKLVSVSLRTVAHGQRPGRVPNYLARSRAAAHCAALGFDLLGVAPEGCLDLRRPEAPRERPMFPKRLLGLMDQNIELVARKPPPGG